MVQVLLIEPYAPLARALQKGLEEEGFAVSVATGRQEGSKKVQGQRFDAIVIDLDPPEHQGLDLLKSWRQSGLTTPVLLVTLPGHSPMNNHGGDLGRWDAVTKPPALGDLLTRLKSLVGMPAPNANGMPTGK